MSATIDSEYRYNSEEFAAKVGYASSKTVLRHAAKLNLGIALGGRAGHRFSDADVTALIEHLRPTPAPVRKRKRRAA